MMKVLNILPQLPFPTDNGGKVDEYNLISIFDNVFDEMTIITFYETEIELDGIETLKKRFKSIKQIIPVKIDIHIKDNRSKLFIAFIKSYTLRKPYIVSKYISKKMFKAIKQEFFNNYFDLVFINHYSMTSYGEYINRNFIGSFNKIFIRSQNVESNILYELAMKHNGLKRIILKHEYRRTVKHEIASNSIYDKCLCIGESDYNFFRDKTKKENISLFLPPYKNDRDNSVRIFEGDLKMLFVGNLSWTPNRDGLKWFIDEVLPIISQYIPSSKLYIIGSGTLNFPISNKNVEMVGFVNDLDDAYLEKHVFIVPLLMGSGIRMKILEAWSYSIPVISTAIGASSLPVKHMYDVIIANSATNFAEAIISLWNDKILLNNLSSNGLKTLNKYFSMSSKIEEFKTYLGE